MTWRSRRSRWHPSSAEAAAALRAGLCIYAPVSTCSGEVRPVGFRDREDTNAVLVCKAHYGRLRRLDPGTAERLERVLVREFERVA